MTGASASDSSTILAKPGVTYEMRAIDQQRCRDAAQRAPVTDVPPEHPHPMVMAYGTSVGSGVGAAIGAAIADEAMIEEDIRQGRLEAEQKCLRYLGYVQLPFTAAEAKEYNRLSSAEQAVWEKNFLATDLSARLDLSIKPKVMPLPAYRADIATQGGLKIDTASLTVTTAQVTDHGDIVAGKAARWRTAVLKTPIDTGDGNIRVTADAGTVFHQVDYRVQYEKLLRNPAATWCGPAMEVANGNTAKSLYCFTGGPDGYDVYRPTGQDWFAGPYRDGFKLSSYKTPIVLEERAQDDLGPIDFIITVKSMKSHVVQVSAYLQREGKQVEVWSRALPFNSRGQTIVPLWDRRLWLTRTASDTVKADFTNDGDGTSWRETD
jgi:hypothetical protein